MITRIAPTAVFLLWALAVALGADSAPVSVVFLVLAAVAFLLNVQETNTRRRNGRPSV